MKIETDTKLDFQNVLIRPKRTTLNSRSEVNLKRVFKFPHSKTQWEGIPIVAANMDTTGTFPVYDVLSTVSILTCLNKFIPLEEFKKRKWEANPNLFMVSTGISDSDFENLKKTLNTIDCNWICIDIANGYISSFVDFCVKVRTTFPDKIIIAGNVATREMVEELIVRGKVDIVKIGIGPGSACTTRLKTGVGMPQLSAIIECADAAHGVGGFIMGDGGITCPGDMAKAFGGGADFVMMGGQFAGHDENPGELIEIDNKKYKLFYGMSSDHAMKKHYGSMANYRGSEGRVLKVPYRGRLINTLNDYLAGLRSTCTYINAKCIKNIPKCTTFVIVSQQLNTHFC
jgi:GMP reductase